MITERLRWLSRRAVGVAALSTASALGPKFSGGARGFQGFGGGVWGLGFGVWGLGFKV